MKRYIQHEFLKISHFTAKKWEHPVHNHNHFEIIFIHRGQGVHRRNEVDYNYKDKTLFLLGPSDYHTFEIEKETEFTFLKFSNQYLKSIGTSKDEQANWNLCIDELLLRSGIKNENILKNEYDAGVTDVLIRLIVQDWKQNNNETNELIFFLIQSVLAIIKKNLCPSKTLLPETKFDQKVNAILDYIHSNIYSSENIQVERLAEKFGYSKNYLGTFFKEQVGISLRDYLSNYKLTIIENRLKHSSFSLKEISYQLGFTDLSHFNKFFKKYRQVSPSELRKEFKKEVNRKREE